MHSPFSVFLPVPRRRTAEGAWPKRIVEKSNCGPHIPDCTLSKSGNDRALRILPVITATTSAHHPPPHPEVIALDHSSGSPLSSSSERLPFPRKGGHRYAERIINKNQNNWDPSSLRKLTISMFSLPFFLFFFFNNNIILKRPTTINPKSISPFRQLYRTISSSLGRGRALEYRPRWLEFQTTCPTTARAPKQHIS